MEARLASTLIEEVNISVFVDRSTASQRPRRVKWELFSAINLCGFVSDALTERRQFAAVCWGSTGLILSCLFGRPSVLGIHQFAHKTNAGVAKVAPALFCFSFLTWLSCPSLPSPFSCFQLMSRFPCFSGWFTVALPVERRTDDRETGRSGNSR